MHKEFSLALLKDKPAVLSYIMFGLKVYDLHDLHDYMICQSIQRLRLYKIRWCSMHWFYTKAK